MQIPLIYEVPLFLFVLLAIYTIIQLSVARTLLTGGLLQKPYSWFIAATVFFALWGADHIYHDLIPLSPERQMFFHYGISHAFLLISMICITIAAAKTKKTYMDIAQSSSELK